MRSAVGVLVLLALQFGCAHSFTGTGSPVGVRAGSVNGVQASLSYEGLYGPNIAIKRGNLFFRGTLMNRVVDLGWDESQVRGMVDSAPTSLTWTQEGDGVRIRGLYGGKLTNLRVTSQSIEGNLGDCGYSLEAARRGYRGRATCLGGFEQEAEVLLPDDLGIRPEGEQVALLALILSGGPERTQRDLAYTAESPSPGVDHFWAPDASTTPTWTRQRQRH